MIGKDNLTTSHAPLFLAGGDHSIQRCLGVLLNSNTNKNINSGSSTSNSSKNIAIQ